LAADVAAVEIVTVRPDDNIAALMSGNRLDRLRVLGEVADDVRGAWRAAGLDLDSTPVVAIAEVELRRWVREQSVSWTRHRHGRLLVDAPVHAEPA
jgi:RHH-type proline utilization regulon transcriptional repressor/proline dehydrogenase/delta 1-pyrroline-5-carboxylate dehydrogenase